MDKNGYLRKFRMFLADPDGKMWDDVELNTILDEALEQYCFDSGAFTGNFDFSPDKNGVYHFPDDYSGFMIGWNSRGEEIERSTAKELFARSMRNANRTGEVQFIYDDVSSSGEFSVYPVPENMQNSAEITITPDYGEITDTAYGVFIDNDYGITLDVGVFDHAGTVYYRKAGTFEEVKDYMSIIFYAMSLAYRADSEFGNAELSDHWLGVYKNRIASFGRILHNNTGKAVSVNFY